MKLIRSLSLISAVAIMLPAAFAQLETSHKPTVQTASLPQARPTGDPGKVVARVNGVAITQDIFDQELKRVFPYYSLHGNAAPKGYETEIHDKALNTLIDNELAYQEAKRRKIQLTPVEWQKRIAQLRKDYKTQAEFDAAAKRVFGTRKTFDEALRHDMLMEKIYRLEVKQKAVVTEADARKEYVKYKPNYAMPELVQFQTISLLFPKNATAADKAERLKKIEEIAAKAKATKNSDEFGLLAEKVSEDEYRVMMGVHKPAHKGSMDPAFEGFILGMKEGQVAGPVESSIGYHIIRLNKHDWPHQLTYAEARSGILKSLREDKVKARNKSFHEALRKTAKVEILS